MWKDRTETERGKPARKLKPFFPAIRLQIAAMALSSDWIMDLLVPILKVILAAITPFLRAALEEFLIKEYKEALETENEFDDLLFEFLLRILSIPIPA